MTYVDAFVLSVPRDKLEEYKSAIAGSADIWTGHGALSYVECVADDVPYGELTSFPRSVMAKDDEVVILSWVTYASRADRDRISPKVMGDPRMTELMGTLPVDGNRMIFGGFETLIER